MGRIAIDALSGLQRQAPSKDEGVPQNHKVVELGSVGPNMTIPRRKLATPDEGRFEAMFALRGLIV